MNGTKRQKSKTDLILDDFLSEIGLITTIDISTLLPKTEPVTVERTYSEVYKEYPEKLNKIFSILHQKINNSFNFMNNKMAYNRHFNANESRELIDIISKLNYLSFNLINEGIEITITAMYKNIIKECENFLKSSGGSTIPDDFSNISIIRYEPVFFVNNSSAMTTRQQAASIKQEFDNKYMQQQIEQMVESIEKHPSDAIDKAKELIESCCKTILSKDGNDTDLNLLDINTLIKKVKEKLDLESNHPSVKQIIGGLSGVATGIAQLRNAKGTGHGKDAVKFKEPSEIEARLAVDSAITLVHFFWELSKSKK